MTHSDDLRNVSNEGLLLAIDAIDLSRPTWFYDTAAGALVDEGVRRGFMERANGRAQWTSAGSTARFALSAYIPTAQAKHPHPQEDCWLRITPRNAIQLVAIIGWTWVNEWQDATPKGVEMLRAMVNARYYANGEKLDMPTWDKARWVAEAMITRPGSLITAAATDLGYDLARQAHNGTSLSPEDRAGSALRGYVQHLQAVVDEFEPWRTADNEAELRADLEQYRDRYTRREQEILGTRGRMVSQAITGAGGWTGRMLRQQEKVQASYRRRVEEMSDWQERALRKLRQRYDPALIARAPIRTEDADATERLQEKIAQAEALQETMKAVNKTVRRFARSMKAADLDDKAREGLRLALAAETGWSDRTLDSVMTPDYMGRIGFAKYQLSNNGAEIRRLRQRLEKVEALAEAEPVEKEVNGIRIEQDPEANRVRIFFPGKPDADTRSKLKSRGFRWAPTVGAWQRYLTPAAVAIAEQIVNGVG